VDKESAVPETLRICRCIQKCRSVYNMAVKTETSLTLQTHRENIVFIEGKESTTLYLQHAAGFRPTRSHGLTVTVYGTNHCCYLNVPPPLDM